MSPTPASTIAAVRGASTVSTNDAPSILSTTTELLATLMSRNGLAPDQLISVLFTVTADLDADFPAHAARRMGWDAVPMLCAREIPVPGALERVVRVLLTVRVEPGRPALRPAYLGLAASLRADLEPPPASGGPRIAIIGVGQIGGSIGLALRGRGWHRAGFDVHAATLAAAVAAGAIDVAAESFAAACADADLAVVAVPVDVAPAAIEATARALPRGAVLLDTCSARGPITPALARARRLGIIAVGGHPLAGTEGHGFAAARGDLFRNAGFALLPGDATVPTVVAALIRDLGAHAVRTDPASHDRGLARASHLPYLLSCALHDLGAEAAAAGLTGPGFRDMTRLAASDPLVAGAYCGANADEIESAWRDLRADVDRRVAKLAR